MQVYIIGSLRDPKPDAPTKSTPEPTAGNPPAADNLPAAGNPPDNRSQADVNGQQSADAKSKSPPLENKPPVTDTRLYEEARRFQAAAYALGYAFGKEDVTIRVCTVGWKAFFEGSMPAEYVIQGANAAGYEMKKRINVIFDVPKPRGQPATAIDPVAKLVRLKDQPNVNVRLNYLRVTDDAHALPDDLSESDAFVLLGGGENTLQLAYGAHLLGKPLIPVRSFGRKAEEVYNLIVRDDLCDESAEEVCALCAQWKAENWNQGTEPDKPQENQPDKPSVDNQKAAGEVVELTKRLLRNERESNRRSKEPLVATLFAMAGLLAIWVWLYLQGSQAQEETAAIQFFALLYSSALIGSGLRVLRAYSRPDMPQLTRWSLAIEAVMGLVIAFGLALIYLIGGITFTSDVVVFETGDDQVFATVALSMSLLGLAAGFLQPLASLESRLNQAIAERRADEQRA